MGGREEVAREDSVKKDCVGPSSSLSEVVWESMVKERQVPRSLRILLKSCPVGRRRLTGVADCHTCGSLTKTSGGRKEKTGWIKGRK